MNTKELIESLKDDQDTVKTIAEMNDPEKVYEFLKTKGLTDSFEEFKNTVAEIKENDGQLSEEELDAVSGGADHGTVTTLTTVTTITAAASAAI